MTIRSHIETAGKFNVKQIPCHYYHEPVNLSLPRTGVVHTWESTGWNGVVSEFKRKYAPHFMIGHKQGIATIAQLVPVGFMGAAMKGHNNMAIIQIELAGFSKTTPWLPEPDLLDALCSLMNVCWREWGIPQTHPWVDGDFGLAGSSPRNTHRKSGYYGTVPGWMGHGDVPDPDLHWDPGNLEWSKVFAHCHELETANVVA